MAVFEQVVFFLANSVNLAQMNCQNTESVIKLFKYSKVGLNLTKLKMSLIITILSLAFFLIGPIVLFIRFLIQRKKKKIRTLFDKLSTGFLLSGTLIALNNFVLFMLFGINLARSVSEVSPFILVNYLIVGLVLLLFIGSIWAWRKTEEITKRRKVLFMATAILVVLFIFVLSNWNFFTSL